MNISIQPITCYQILINDVMEQDNMYSVSFLTLTGLITGQTRTIFAMWWHGCVENEHSFWRYRPTFRQSCNSASQVIVRFGLDQCCSLCVSIKKRLLSWWRTCYKLVIN